MRTKEQVALVLDLVAAGLNDCEIGRRTGIPRRTVLDWRHGKTPRQRRRPQAWRSGVSTCPTCGHEEHIFGGLPVPEYTYLLGVYLGDGCISQTAKGGFVLRLFQDMRYEDLIDDWAGAVKTVMPDNAVNVQYQVGGGNCACIVSSSKSWPCLFPQHGSGPKHKRQIVLTRWQQELIDRDPRPLIAGLIHSDGCRFINPSMGYKYVRYMFTNASHDIRGIFCNACDQLEIPWRQSNPRTISIARREGVEMLDSFIGPKS
jgi:hypothetical protein